MGKDVKMQSEKFALNLSYFGELPLAIAVDVRQKVQFANSKHFANPKLVSENAQRDVQDGGRIPLISIFFMPSEKCVEFGRQTFR